jgi:hypothetical protein
MGFGEGSGIYAGCNHGHERGLKKRVERKKCTVHTDWGGFTKAQSTTVDAPVQRTQCIVFAVRGGCLRSYDIATRKGITCGVRS